jgi:hypothetical protein
VSAVVIAPFAEHSGERRTWFVTARCRDGIAGAACDRIMAGGVSAVDDVLGCFTLPRASHAAGPRERGAQATLRAAPPPNCADSDEKVVKGTMTDPARVALFAVDMGYGHLRAAMPLADELGIELCHADQPPFADQQEEWLWTATRGIHRLLSKPTRLAGLMGRWAQTAMDAVTLIPPLYESSDLSAPGAAARLVGGLVDLGLGRGLGRYLKTSELPLLTTFYLPAMIADHAGCERIFCVVTDADCHRVWVARSPAASRIHYFAPSSRVVRRLEAYGVSPARISLTGFPLPGELLGGPELGGAIEALGRRLVRLDPEGVFRRQYRHELRRLFPDGLPASEAGEPLRITFAVGGAGAQAELVPLFLPSLGRPLREGRLRLALVAGMRPQVAESFERAVDSASLTDELGRGLRVMADSAFSLYYRHFNQLLRETDVLWTKPSELSFYAALGLPLVLSRPVGSHERYNRRWLLEHGAALRQHDPRYTWEWIAEWLRDGTLAAAAWSAFTRLPQDGTYRIAEIVRRSVG